MGATYQLSGDVQCEVVGVCWVSLLTLHPGVVQRPGALLRQLEAQQTWRTTFSYITIWMLGSLDFNSLCLWLFGGGDKSSHPYTQGCKIKIKDTSCT